MKATPPAFGEVEVVPVCGPSSVGADTGLAVPTIVEPKAQPDTATSVGDTASDWLCAWCHHRVANESLAGNA